MSCKDWTNGFHELSLSSCSDFVQHFHDYYPPPPYLAVRRVLHLEALASREHVATLFIAVSMGKPNGTYWPDKRSPKFAPRLGLHNWTWNHWQQLLKSTIPIHICNLIVPILECASSLWIWAAWGTQRLKTPLVPNCICRTEYLMVQGQSRSRIWIIIRQLDSCRCNTTDPLLTALQPRIWWATLLSIFYSQQWMRV